MLAIAELAEEFLIKKNRNPLGICDICRVIGVELAGDDCIVKFLMFKLFPTIHKFYSRLNRLPSCGVRSAESISPRPKFTVLLQKPPDP